MVLKTKYVVVWVSSGDLYKLPFNWAFLFYRWPIIAIWPILTSYTSLVASLSLSHHNWQKIAPLLQFAKWRSSPFSRISNPKASLGLEVTERKTQLYLATFNWGGFEATEYRPLVCEEEGNQSGDLAIGGGHGNAQEEYVMTGRRIHWLVKRQMYSIISYINPWRNLGDL